MTQKEALHVLKQGKNVYLTGPAGSGKTYLLNQFISYLKDSRVDHAVTASTGIAATHLDGTTIHSWAGIGINKTLSTIQIKALAKKKHLRDRFKSVRVLIIDEVSMLHAHTLDLVDSVCKAFRGNILPFGGIQVVLCGDFFQLPPVAGFGEEVSFVYKSNAWQESNLNICYLNKQHRQKDNQFTEVLNAIRDGLVSNETKNILMSRFEQEVSSKIRPTNLYTHNANVDAINSAAIEKISGKSKRFDMTYIGPDILVDFIKKNCLAPPQLILKVGAIVMFVKNNYQEGYVNGTLGKIIDFKGNLPLVETLDGTQILVTREEWKIDDNSSVKASIKQIPLRLAWAITIHKSQGMSLDAAIIDLSKSFVTGMGYVALSRVRSLSGINLMGLNNMALQVNQDVLQFDKALQVSSKKVAFNIFPV